MIEGEVSFHWVAENLPEIGYKKYREIMLMIMVQPINNYNLEHYKKLEFN